jgi:glycosyltransferase involved in cell wall biosynthesis
MNAAPSVSIIIPAFNKGNFIEQSLKSVLAQTFASWELIVIDDHSTDDTAWILRKFSSSDKRIRLYELEQNRGGNYCRNYGLKQAIGQYILFMDADDLLAPDCLLNRIALMDDHPTFDAGIFPMEVFRSTQGDTGKVWSPSKENALQRFLAHDLPWQTMQPVWRRDFIEKTGGFDEQFPRLQDVEFHTRALLQHDLQFKVFPGSPDCFFRTAEERKNFDTKSFLHKWVTGAVLYFKKFYLPAKEKDLDKYLNGTLYHTYMQLLWALKQQKISKDTFGELKQLLFEANVAAGLPFSKKAILQVAGFYNLLPVRIPGINLALTKLITL